MDARPQDALGARAAQFALSSRTRGASPVIPSERTESRDLHVPSGEH
jgi:hypothetical protein